MRSLSRFLLGAAMVIAVGQPRAAEATPLNLTLLPAPDIFSTSIDITYDAETDVFTADGFSLTFQFGPELTDVVAITEGTFQIDIVTDGTTASSNGDLPDLLITGNIDVTGDGVPEFSGQLVAGRIASFGFSDAGPGLFEFTFDLLEGALSEVYGNGTVPVGVILGAGGNSNYTGSFAADFDNLIGGAPGSGSGSADTGVVPEPGTVVLLGSGIVALAMRRRR